MKKTISLLLAIILLLSLTACASTNSESQQKETEKDIEEITNIIESSLETISSEETEPKTCCGCGAVSGVEYCMETFTPPHNYVCLDCFTKYSVCVDCNDVSNKSSYRSDFDKYYCDECYVQNQICIYCCSKDATYRGRYYFCDECYDKYGK